MFFHLTPLQTLDLETIVSIVVFALVVYAVFRLEALHRRVSVLPKPVGAVKPAPAPKPPPRPNPIAVVMQHIGAGISAGIAAAKAPVAKTAEPAWPLYDAPGPAPVAVVSVQAEPPPEPLPATPGSLLPGGAFSGTSKLTADQIGGMNRIYASGAFGMRGADIYGNATPLSQQSSAPEPVVVASQPEPTHAEVPVDPVPAPAPAPVPVIPPPSPIVTTPPIPTTVAPTSAQPANLQPGVTAEAAAAFEAEMEARNVPTPARVILNADGKPMA